MADVARVRIHAEAMDAILERWQIHGERFEILPLNVFSHRHGGVPNGVCGIIMIPANNQLECVIGTEAILEDLKVFIDQFLGIASQINLVVPIAMLGNAHMQLRGSVDTLQGWWAEGSATRFTERELA